MKPTELTNWINPEYKWLKIENGCNCSLTRNKDKDCVIAYYKIDVVTYMVLKVSKGYKVYRVAEFEKNFVGEQIVGGKVINFNLTIVNNEEFGKFKKELLVNAL